jgi:hypothetical protein
LDEGPAPVGRHLFSSQKVDSLSFMPVGSEWFVRFRERVTAATNAKGGVYNLWVSSFDGTTQRKVVTDWSDRGPEMGNANGRYFLVNERTIPSGGGSAVVGNWLRLGPTLDEEARIDGVSLTAPFSPFSAPLSWTIDNPQSGQSCPGFPDRHDDCPQALFERPPLAGQPFPTLYLWDGKNEIPIGEDPGGFQNQIMGDGSLYSVLGDRRTLSRLSRPSNRLDSLRDNVFGYSVSGDQHYVALSVIDDGKSKTVIRDLRTGVEITPARPNPSGWGGFGGNTFYYAVNAVGSSPAELHQFNLDTGEDTFTTLPLPLVNLAAQIDRPNSDERLRIDSLGQAVFTGKNDLVVRRVLSEAKCWNSPPPSTLEECQALRILAGPPLVPSFTKDGSYLIYIQRGASTQYDPALQGALMFQDADLKQPPAMISPPGLVLSIQGQAPYFFTGNDDVLGFWAHLGRAGSDLYFADYQAGTLPTNLRLVAQSIMNVGVSAHSLFGIVNVSQQDNVGDLVYRDLDLGTEIRYAQGVSEATKDGPPNLPETWVLYNVRGRADSDRSGVWLSAWIAPVRPDGGND